MIMKCLIFLQVSLSILIGASRSMVTDSEGDFTSRKQLTISAKAF